ncbi:MAG: adenylate/guanylate cyclase domain-containing protein [Gammaproteobacteria bacterium]|nr:adenylate/guanylate cyclase domain-containing protein [Gammaproteobacteria bacterium]NND58681.1 adenylate/guanylate cyclase domain-containing protein [Gammaproteobacteria bacterium]
MQPYRDNDSSPELVDDPGLLASLQGWSEEVYVDFLALQNETMTEDEFRQKYEVTRAILDLDITGFTESCMHEGQIASLLRIFDTQKVVVPILQRHGAQLMRAFADDLVALFRNVDNAVDAALEIHEQIDAFNHAHPRERPPQCCIGIGYGAVFAIGPNLAQGDEMNRASKLGEDTARGGETLLTENAIQAIGHRHDIEAELQQVDDLLFPYYRVTRVEND